ncbi:FtsW/RodA/SpoVE family cell cycle protein [Streptomyces formicae]|uniref:Cell division protein FtsW n=1 Tax=Streptomyces formicae TaxID=1616117 RepID=A0A291Q328_9ACTN|nr:FtsW/RodA/SpoVE family cell cycle protein [Streptomyces formicae]ATL25897.1 Cell division protein FtsW [Streptomyces formicae]
MRGLNLRRTEAVLLALAVAVVVLGHASAGLALSGELPGQLAGFAASQVCLAAAAHLAVRRYTPYADPLVLPLAFLLTGLSLVLLARLDPAYAARYDSAPASTGQLVWTVLAVAAAILLLRFLRNYRRLQRYLYVAMAVSLALLMAPAFFPGDTYGAKRWVYLGPFSFQPGEFAKVTIVIFFAAFLVPRRDALALTGRRVLGLTLPHGRHFGPIAAVWLLSLLVLVFERDLGTSLLFFGVFIVMLYIATERTSWVVCGIAMAAVGATAVGATEPHVRGRILAWLHPFDIYLPPDQRPPGLVSDQAAQALFGFGSGGVTGTGLGQGHPELIGFAGRSDFILTTVGEELGLAGMMAVLLLYTLLVQRGLRTAIACDNPFGKLLAAGLSLVLALQVFIVTAGVTGLMPFTGKALPFLAQGGSSMVANWLLVSLLLVVSHQAGAKHRAREDQFRDDVQETASASPELSRI